MGSVRRATTNQFLLFLALNVIVSAVTVLIVLAIWDRRSAPRLDITPSPTLDIAAQVASAVPTPTATLRPSPTPAVYVVRPGDTLFAIARELGVDMEALMAANEITNPNALDAGQRLLIPQVEGGAQPAVPPASTPQPTVTPNPDSQAPRVEIREVTGAGNLETETIVILNTGGQADMAGWTLDDDSGHQYVFPSFVLHNSGAASVHTKAGRDTAIDLYWGLETPLWTPGTLITLRDQNGSVQSTFRIPGS